MPKAHLDRCWSYAEGPFSAKAYGPGETEIPQGLYELLSEKGYLDSPKDSLEDVDGISESLASELREAGFNTVEDVNNATQKELVEGVASLNQSRAKAIKKAAKG